MPELAEVEWYRKQWDEGRGQTVVSVSLNAGRYVLRGTDEAALRRGFIGKTLTGSERHGKQMLFRFSENHFLGVHLGMALANFLSHRLGFALRAIDQKEF
jgi:formamidopyrimidine-DNA glycosylase